jgi:RNA methyltransferase, TrmH family
VDRALPSGGRSRRFDSCREYLSICDFGFAIYDLSSFPKMNQFLKISSRDNQKLKFARAVRDGREDEKIFVEGLRLAEEVLKTDLKVEFAFFTTKFLENLRGAELIKSLVEQNIDSFELENRIFDSLADTRTSQGVILIADKPNVGKKIIEQNLSTNPLIVLLHQINNPANLGAILRTAEAVGAKGIITTKGTADVFSPKTIRGAMGANLRLPFWVNAEFSEAMIWAKLHGIKSVCADIRSKKSYLEIDWKIPRLLVVGSEGHGLTDEERLATDESLLIPMANEVESLNVAVACGVILFEAKRQKEGSKVKGKR